MDHGGPSVPRPPHDGGRSELGWAGVHGAGPQSRRAGLPLPVGTVAGRRLTLPAVHSGPQAGRHGLPHPCPPVHSWPASAAAGEVTRTQVSRGAFRRSGDHCTPFPILKQRWGRRNGRTVTAALVGPPPTPFSGLCTLLGADGSPIRSHLTQGLTWVKPPTPESLPKAVYALRSPPLPGGEERVSGRRPRAGHVLAPGTRPHTAAQRDAGPRRPVDEQAPPIPPDAAPTARRSTPRRDSTEAVPTSSSSLSSVRGCSVSAARAPGSQRRPRPAASSRRGAMTAGMLLRATRRRHRVLRAGGARGCVDGSAPHTPDPARPEAAPGARRRPSPRVRLWLRLGGKLGTSAEAEPCSAVLSRSSATGKDLVSLVLKVPRFPSLPQANAAGGEEGPHRDAAPFWERTNQGRETGGDWPPSSE